MIESAIKHHESLLRRRVKDPRGFLILYPLAFDIHSGGYQRDITINSREGSGVIAADVRRLVGNWKVLVNGSDW